MRTTFFVRLLRSALLHIYVGLKIQQLNSSSDLSSPAFSSYERLHATDPIQANVVNRRQLVRPSPQPFQISTRGRVSRD